MTMSRSAFLAAVHRPGAFQRVTFRSDERGQCAASRNNGNVLHKVTSATMRTGIDYANTAAVEAAGIEPGPLPDWSEWVTPGYVLRHKSKGTEYARMFILTDSLDVTYYVNGEKVTRDEYRAHLTSSARERKAPLAGVLSVKLDNILSMS